MSIWGILNIENNFYFIHVRVFPHYTALHLPRRPRVCVRVRVLGRVPARACACARVRVLGCVRVYARVRMRSGVRACACARLFLSCVRVCRCAGRCACLHLFWAGAGLASFSLPLSISLSPVLASFAL